MSVLAGHEEEILQSYLSGESARSLATRHHVGDQTIARLLERHGIPRRRTQPVGKALAELPPVEPDPQISALAECPAGLAYIAV